MWCDVVWGGVISNVVVAGLKDEQNQESDGETANPTVEEVDSPDDPMAIMDVGQSGLLDGMGFGCDGAADAASASAPVQNKRPSNGALPASKKAVPPTGPAGSGAVAATPAAPGAESFRKRRKGGGAPAPPPAISRNTSGEPAPAAAEDVQPAAEAPPSILTFDELAKYPADGGVSQYTSQKKVKSGQGRRSQEEMDLEDKLFIAQRIGELKGIADLEAIPVDDEQELEGHCKEMVRSATALATRCGSKLTQTKRRRNGGASGAEDTAALKLVPSIAATAQAFQNFYREISASAPLGAQVTAAMKVPGRGEVLTWTVWKK